MPRFAKGADAVASSAQPVLATVWYVAHTKPRQEALALQQLQQQGFEVYLPLFKVYKKPRRGAKAATRTLNLSVHASGTASHASGAVAQAVQVAATGAASQARPAAPTGANDLVTHEPMFPRYLFLRPTRPTQSLSVVRSTLGVSRLVLFGQRPATLADAAVQRIRQAEALREGAALNEVSPYQPGMTVHIQNSPLAGAQALVHAVSKDRVTLLLNVLGRPQTVQVEFGQIALP